MIGGSAAANNEGDGNVLPPVWRFFVLLAATGTFYLAGVFVLQGNPIAEVVCFTGGAPCQYRGILAVAAAGTGLLWITMRD